MGVLSIVLPFDTVGDIDRALAATTWLNLQQLRAYKVPALYASGVRYQRETCLAPRVPGACERFLTARQTLIERFGDCDDLACWRAAELIVQGERARAFAVRSPVGFHILVRREDGRTEDPSKLLGM